MLATHETHGMSSSGDGGDGRGRLVGVCGVGLDDTGSAEAAAVTIATPEKFWQGAPATTTGGTIGMSSSGDGGDGRGRLVGVCGVGLDDTGSAEAAAVTIAIPEKFWQGAPATTTGGTIGVSSSLSTMLTVTLDIGDDDDADIGSGKLQIWSIVQGIPNMTWKAQKCPAMKDALSPGLLQFR